MDTKQQNRLLYLILIAIVVGAVVGGQFPQQAVYLQFLGDLFLNALKMVVVPLVMASMIIGVTNLGDIRKLGGIGKRTVIYYMVTTGFSVLIGLILVNIIRPGIGVRHGEDLPDASYVLEEKRILVEESRFQESQYDDRYQVTLQDQEIYGVVDSRGMGKAKGILVVEWREQETHRRASPVSSGKGVRVSLKVAESVHGKERPIFEVLTDVLVGMVPTNIFRSMVEMDVLPLIVFSLLFGGTLTTLGERAQSVIDFINGVNQAIMKIVNIVIAFAPIGILALIAARMGKSGGWAGFWPELVKLAWYASTVIAGLLIHAFVVLPLILLLVARRRVFRYGRNMLTALSTAFSTASSSATLPLTMECVEEKNGISKRVGSFVLPLGATINMDGTALYEAVAAVFIAQVYGITLGPVEQVIIFLTATLAAIGAAGIPEAGLVTMVIVLRAVGLPIEGITLLLVIDWFLDRCRTTVNVWGDSVGAGVIAYYEGEHEESGK